MIDRLFPPPDAALLGEDSQIPAALQQAFRDTGTSHIIAISGLETKVYSEIAQG